jgi:hypothetical protein
MNASYGKTINILKSSDRPSYIHGLPQHFKAGAR